MYKRQAENKEGVRLTSVVMGGKNSDKRYAANLKNLRTGFTKVDADPTLAVAYKKPANVQHVAMTSPKSAFTDKPERGAARQVVAQAPRAKAPRSSFNHVSYRGEGVRSGMVSAVYHMPAAPTEAPVTAEPAVTTIPTPQVDVSSLTSARTTMDRGPAANEPEMTRPTVAAAPAPVRFQNE